MGGETPDRRSVRCRQPVSPVSGDGGRGGRVGRRGSTRRAILAGIGAGAVATFGSVGTASANLSTEATGDPWRIVALPDTQTYPSTDIRADGELFMDVAHSQTEWIAAHAESANIAFVSHEGDVVWNGYREAEFERMDAVMSRLDGVVPYGACMGNHDYTLRHMATVGAGHWKTYFGADRYRGYDWFGGADPSGRNYYQLFEAGGYEFLNISLEFEPPGSVADPESPVGWAQRVIDDHPERAVILTTHAYLSDSVEGRYTEHHDFVADGHTGQQLWEALVRPNDQVFMVLGGHFVKSGDRLIDPPPGEDDGEYHQVSENHAGSPVYEILANYQNRTKGGDGWLRLLSFVPGGGEDGHDRIEIETYSPSLDAYQTGPESRFGFDLDFDDRFDDFAASESPDGDGTDHDDADSGSGGERDGESDGDGEPDGDGDADECFIFCDGGASFGFW